MLTLFLKKVKKMFFFIAVLLVIIYVWPGMYKRMKPTAREAQFWGNVCSTVSERLHL